MNFDKFKKMSIEDLEAVRSDLEKAIEHVKNETRVSTLAKLQEIAEGAGFDLAELVDSAKKPAKKSALPAKYKHPKDPTKTWSGRGRKPFWFSEALDKEGLTEEDLLVSQ